MNDETNPQTQTPKQHSGRTNADYQPDKNDQQEKLQKQGNGKNAQGQDRGNQSGGRSGDESTTSSADSMGTEAQRSGEDRKQSRSDDGTSRESQRGSTGNRPGATGTSKPDGDIDLHNDDLEESDGSKKNKSDAAKQPNADSSKTIRHGNDSGRADSDRDHRGQNNPNQSGRKN